MNETRSAVAPAGWALGERRLGSADSRGGARAARLGSRVTRRACRPRVGLASLMRRRPPAPPFGLWSRSPCGPRRSSAGMTGWSPPADPQAVSGSVGVGTHQHL